MSDITIKELSTPVVPRFNPSQKGYVGKDVVSYTSNDTSPGQYLLDRKEITKMETEIKPVAEDIPKPIEPPDIENIKIKLEPPKDKDATREMTQIAEQIDSKTSELDSIREKKRILEEQIVELNKKLNSLRTSVGGMNVDNLEFKLTEDNDSYYVDLYNTDQNMLIKEISMDDMQSILNTAQDDHSRGVLLDLFR